jgi:tubulin polyglutamylase TTLL9
MAARTRQIRFRTTFRNTIYDLFKSKGWTETESDTDWDVAWVDKDWIRENFLQQTLADHQRINHFPNHYELTRKDNLIKNLKRTQRALQREGLVDEAARYDFFPGTWLLPADYGLFVEEFKNYPSGTIWIMKPTGSAQGKGIFLFTRLQQINDWKKDSGWKTDAAQAASYVVQRYIENPQLIGGKKFDLRLYVLVTSYNPLTVYIYRSGFARFSSYRYNTTKANLSDTYVHLTNVAVQKTGPGFDAGAGSKWPLRNYRLFLVGKYGHQATDRMFLDVEELCVNTLLSVQKVMISDKHCFEMYGYDILIDETLKPWLIEVNASPSITADTIQDYDLKFGLLEDVYSVVDVEQKLGHGVDGRPLEPTVGGFDLIYHGEKVRPDRQATYTSKLGCFDPADRQRGLRKLWASVGATGK